MLFSRELIAVTLMRIIVKKLILSLFCVWKPKRSGFFLLSFAPVAIMNSFVSIKRVIPEKCKKKTVLFFEGGGDLKKKSR